MTDADPGVRAAEILLAQLIQEVPCLVGQTPALPSLPSHSASGPAPSNTNFCGCRRPSSATAEGSGIAEGP